ncbi:MAG: adenylate/guanylate cyclase domain-containing protein [Cyanobacteria bacterium P01_C01_bin.89]
MVNSSSLGSRFRTQIPRGRSPKERPTLRTLQVAALVGIIIVALRTLGLLQGLELGAFDNMVEALPLAPPDDRVVIVEFSETDLQRFQQWPLTDRTLAELLRTIQSGNPRTVGLDIVRDFAVPPGKRQLDDVFQTMPNLVGIRSVTWGKEDSRIEAPPLLLEQGQVAASDLLLDDDLRVRRGLLSLVDERGELWFGLGARLALDYLAADDIYLEPIAEKQGVYRLGEGLFKELHRTVGSYINLYTAGYQVLLRYRGLGCADPQMTPGCRFRRIRATELLRGEVDPSVLRDRLVLIGVTADSLKDTYATPYRIDGQRAESVPGVEIHATIASQVLSTAIDGESSLKTWSDSLEVGWILLWALVGGVTIGKLKRLDLSVLSLLGLSTLLVGISYGSLVIGFWIPLVPPLMAFLGGSVANLAEIANRERRDRQLLMGMFEKYVAPQVAELIWQSRSQVIRQGRFVGQEMIATVLFTDLVGFSTIATKTTPNELMAWLNEYMNAMTQVVVSHNGVVNKFIGDAIMAAFGVPLPRSRQGQMQQDAINGVRCAVEMAEQLRQLNIMWKQRGWPTVSMRIGIATGLVTTGCLGGARRLEFTIIGDTVNVASRLEGFDKESFQGECRILISEETQQYVSTRFSTAFFADAVLRGRKTHSNIYQVFPEW